MAVMIGVTLPSIVTGRAPLAVLIPLAFLIALARVWRVRDTVLPRLRPLPPLGWGMIVLLACLAISAALSVDPAGSALVWLKAVGVLAVGLVFYFALSSDPRLVDISLKSMVIASVFAFLLVYLTLFVSHEIMIPIRMRHIGNVDLARQAMKAYGSVMPLMIPLLIWAGWRLRGAWRWVAWLLIPPNVATVPMLQAKAGLLGLAGGLALVLLLWLMLRIAFKWRVALVACLLLIAVAGAGLLSSRLPTPPYQGPQSLRVPTYIIDAHRQIIWGLSVQHVFDRPVFGYGLDTAWRLPGAQKIIPGFEQEYIPRHPHNWVIQLIVEAGWLGLLAALGLLFLLLLRIWRGLRRGYAGAWAAAGATGAFFASSLVNFNVWAYWWQAIFYLVLALTLTAAPRTASAAEASSSAPPAPPSAPVAG